MSTPFDQQAIGSAIAMTSRRHPGTRSRRGTTLADYATLTAFVLDSMSICAGAATALLVYKGHTAAFAVKGIKRTHDPPFMRSRQRHSPHEGDKEHTEGEAQPGTQNENRAAGHRADPPDREIPVSANCLRGSGVAKYLFVRATERNTGEPCL